MANHGLAREQLRGFVERIERLEEEKQAIADDIKEVYAEAKGNGFDVKVLRQVVAIRKQDANERAEQEAILDLYLHALGMIPADRLDAEVIAGTVAAHKAENKGKKKKRGRATDELATQAAFAGFADAMAETGGGVTAGENTVHIPKREKVGADG